MARVRGKEVARAMARAKAVVRITPRRMAKVMGRAG